MSQQAHRQQGQRIQQVQPILSSATAQPPMQQPPAMIQGRLMNGMRTTTSFNGPLTNGIGPPLLSAQQPPPSAFSMSAPGTQPNGIPGHSSIPNAPGSTSGPVQGFNTLLSNQRPPPNGPQPPQRAPAPFPTPSPIMSHANPNNSGVAPATNLQQQPPMGQLGPGPSPHMAPMHRGGMLPPNGQGMNPINPAQQQNPMSVFQRPPSRTTTPAQGNLTQPSPSLAPRQPPAPVPIMQDPNLINEIARIPQPMLTSLRQELGFLDKEPTQMTLVEKVSSKNFESTRDKLKSSSNV